MELGKIRISKRFPSFDELLEKAKMPYPYPYDFIRYMVNTGAFSLIKDDFDMHELEEIRRALMARLFVAYGKILEQLTQDESVLFRRFPLVFDPMRKVALDASRIIREHPAEFEKEAAQAKSKWNSFIHKTRRLYAMELIDSYTVSQHFDTYFIHAPKVEGSKCECIDNISEGKAGSFSIEFFGLGGGGATEVLREEGLVTTIEDGLCSKIQIMCDFLVQVFQFYRMGRKRGKKNIAKFDRMTGIAPVTINPSEDTCGRSPNYLRRHPGLAPIDIDTTRFKSGFVKRTLKLRENLQNDGTISLEVPQFGIRTGAKFRFTNVSEKRFIYTLPRGHVYTYYVLPDTLGYSWTVHL